jgi:adenosine kinase
MSIIVTGSVAFDYLMSFPGRFSEHIIPEQIHHISLSILVDTMRKQRGGCAPNIAYTLALLGERPTVMATVGQDFSEYRDWLDAAGVDTSGIVTIASDFTSSCFINTDRDNNQIVSFYMGAMGNADQLSFHDLDHQDIEVAVISPNAPKAMTKYARECQELGVPYIYDPSQQIVWLNGDELLEGIRGAKVLIGNEYEFGMIKKKTAFSEADLLSLPEVAIVTRGADGSLIYADGQELRVPSVAPELLSEPTGVGDAYRAGLIKGMVHQLPWDVSGRIGSLAAAYVLEQYGPQEHYFTPEAFVERYGCVFGDSSQVEAIFSLEHRRK